MTKLAIMGAMEEEIEPLLAHFENVNVIEFAEYISQLEIKDLESEFPEILYNYYYYKKED